MSPKCINLVLLIRVKVKHRWGVGGVDADLWEDRRGVSQDVWRHSVAVQQTDLGVMRKKTGYLWVKLSTDSI